MTQLRLFSFHEQDSSLAHNQRIASLLAAGVYKGYRIRPNASDPSKLDVTHGNDGTSVLVTVEGVRIQETAEITGTLQVQNADPSRLRYDLVVSEYQWSPNNAIQQTYKVIRGGYARISSDTPPIPVQENIYQIPLAMILVRPQVAIGGIFRVVIDETDVYHIRMASDPGAEDIGTLKPIIDPVNNLRIFVHAGAFPTLDGLSFIQFEGGYSDEIDDSQMVDGETRYFLIGVGDDKGVSIAGESSTLDTVPNLDSDVLPVAVAKVTKRGGSSYIEDLIDIRFPFARKTVPREEEDFYQDQANTSVFRYVRIDSFRGEGLVDLTTLLPTDADLGVVIDRGETSLEVSWDGAGEPSADVTISTVDLLGDSEIDQVRHIMVTVDTDVENITFDYSSVSGYHSFSGRDLEMNKIIGLADGVSQLFLRFKIPASEFNGGGVKRIFSFAVFMVLDYEMLNEKSLSSLGLDSAAYSIPNLIPNGDFRMWSRAPDSSSAYPDVNSRDIISYQINKDDLSTRRSIFAGDGWQFTRLEFDPNDGLISRILWSRDVVGSLDENTMDTALKWVGEAGTAGQQNYLEFRTLAPQGYDGQFVTFAFDYKSQPREAVGIRLVLYERGSDGSLAVHDAVESGPLRTEGTLIISSNTSLNSKVFAIGFIIVLQQTTGISTVYVKNARAAIGRYSVLPFTRSADADDVCSKYYERGQLFASASAEEGEEVGGAVQFATRKLVGLSENNSIAGALAEALSSSRNVNASGLSLTSTERGILARATAAQTGLVVIDVDWEASVVYSPTT